MRRFLLALAAGLVLSPFARSADLRHFDDAPLRAVQFVDANEGWAVGDDGVVWHSIDGGKEWERQPTGVRAALQSLHFLNPFTGWVAGREELPHGGGSAGVLLYTTDGGLRWRRLTLNTIPGINRIRFLDGKTGFAACDSTEQFPSGLFRTSDGGRTWQPVAGPRSAGWLSADFRDAENGALAGNWNRLAMLHQGKLIPADIDTLGGRNLRGIQVTDRLGVAVGQGGLVLLREDAAGSTWAYADLKLPLEMRAGWDFHAVSCAGNHIWAAGRPGSVVLHSADAGRTWEVQTTGQPLPIQGIFFLDEKQGWMVGELGTILTTTDSGRTWTVSRRGGHRAAVLFIHAAGSGVPVDTLALLGGEEGYLAVGLRAHASDPSSAHASLASEPQRFASAMRLAGGAGGELLWQFPLPQHLARADQAELLRSWDRLHGDRAAEQILRQLVLALRIWQPAVIVTDLPDARSGARPVESLVAEAVHEAFQRAADPKVFPEQLERFGLQPWQAAKLYACWPEREGSHVGLDLTEPAPRLVGSARDFATPAAALLSEKADLLPRQRYYRLLTSKGEGAAGQRYLMDGIALAAGGPARRLLPDVAPLTPTVRQGLLARRNLQALVEAGPAGLSDPDRLLGQLAPALAEMPYEQGAPAALAIASQFARLGQWTLAREAFLLMADRYPGHPLTAEAYRWLIRHGSSSEARRRVELGQFRVATQVEYKTLPYSAPKSQSLDPDESVRPPEHQVEMRQTRELTLLGGSQEARKWYQSCLEVEPRLAGFGALFAGDPAVQFALQAARRSLGEFDAARKWYGRFAAEQPPGPWRDAAAAELWLANRSGPPPRPVLFCRQAEERPFLDAKLDDACWQGQKATLIDAVGGTAKEYPTEVRLAWDKDFLYVALQCKHPAGHKVAKVKARTRDADLRPYDRVSLLLDLDRDYATCFHLQVDQRGCLFEECWGDASWNPRWFVAAKTDDDRWTVEAAIPMIELTGDGVTPGRTWACNVSRILPGRGVQAHSTPADVEPRPEGMGLLLFLGEPRPTPPGAPGGPAMPRVP